MCRQLRVQRLYFFGSALTEQFEPGRSDLDVLVQLLPAPDPLDRGERLLSLWDALVMDLRSLPGAHADLEVHTLAELPTGVLVRPGHPLAQRHPVRFADLTEFAVACTGMSAAMGRLLVQRLGLQAHPDTLITLGSESVADLLDVVSHTDAVYLGIVAPAAPLLAQGRLVALDIPTQGLQSHIAWVQRVARTPNPVLDGIRGQVQAWLGEAGSIEQAADLPA